MHLFANGVPVWCDARQPFDNDVDEQWVKSENFRAINQRAVVPNDAKINIHNKQ